MTITDYLINAVFLLRRARQARERELDRRSVIVPLVDRRSIVAQIYLHAMPTGGNDLVLMRPAGAVGLTLGVVCGFATHVRPGENGLRSSASAGSPRALLVAGISSRMVFAFALSHGARPAIAHFSEIHQIGAAAWPSRWC